MGYKLGDIVPLQQVETFPHNSTPLKQGLKLGDLVVNVTGSTFAKGEVLAIHQEDSTNPYMLRANGNHADYDDFHNFAPLSAFGKVETAKPAVTSTLTVYSDGVKVNDSTVEFDGKSWTREELTATVKRYQEILRRPIAVVPEKITTRKVNNKKAVAAKSAKKAGK
jgi:hypothetical protein